MNNENKVVSLLEEINKNLIELNEKINQLISLQGQKPAIVDSSAYPEPHGKLDPFIILDLPKRLSRSANVMLKIGRATASDVASATRQTRESEVKHLNELVAMGYLGKERGDKDVGENPREVYFYLERTGD